MKPDPKCKAAPPAWLVLQSHTHFGITIPLAHLFIHLKEKKEAKPLGMCRAA